MAHFFQTGKKILAVGRNYAEHAKELNNAVPTTAPVFFIKPTSSYVRKGSPIERPRKCKLLHHEVELGVVIGKQGRYINESKAMEHVAGYVVALDMTARDLQDVAKTKALPWTEAKGYNTFCPISDFIPKNEISDPHNIELWLKVDGENKFRQKGNTNAMLFRIPWLISYLSGIMTLDEGDLILTGTPAGVAAVEPGQTMRGGITGMTKYDISFPVIDEKGLAAL